MRARSGVVLGALVLLAAGASAAEAPTVSSLTSVDPCPGLEPLLDRTSGGDWLPITREAQLSQSPESWAGPAQGRCGPVRYWVSLDHVRRLSGATSLDVRVVLHAQAPLLVLGLGWPALSHAEDESGHALEASPTPVENRIRVKVHDAAGCLDTGLSFPLDPRPGSRGPALKPTEVRMLRAAIPAVVVNGFRPLATIADPFRARPEPVRRHGVTVAVELERVSGQVHGGLVRVTTEEPESADIWGGFAGVPVVLEDAAGRVVFQRWLQPRIGEPSWTADIGFTATAAHTPPFALVVFEPNALRIELPLEWGSADVPPLRLEQPPVPPSDPRSSRQRDPSGR